MTTNGSRASQIAHKDLDYYLALPYRLEIVRSEHGDFVASFPELPGCVTQIDDLTDAGCASKEILTGWLELALEDGQHIPEPVEDPGYSGKFVLRIARSLHRELAIAASHEGVSLNAYAAMVLAQGLIWHQANAPYEALSKKLDALTQPDPRSRPDIRAVSR